MHRDPTPGRRRILFLTGTRADFGKLKPLMLEVHHSGEFDAMVFATGMHMLARYGWTVNEIELTGLPDVFRHINQIDSAAAQMDLVLADTVRGLGYFVRENPVDLIVVHGDRVEALAGATVGALNNILVAHVEGGERSGTIDELVRHAVSKMSHIHFVANDEAARRLVQMGEAEESVFVIGSPDIDIMLSPQLPGIDEVRTRYDIAFPGYSIFMYHPVTTELAGLRLSIREAVAALEESGRNFVVVYPNNDPGADIILEAIAPLARHPRFRVFPSLRFEYFLTLLRHADAIVGNSSAGVREAPVYGVPSLNLGSRQHNRFDHPSITNVPERQADILAALAALPAAGARGVPSRHFGAGNSAALFMEEVRKSAFWDTPRQKQFRDVLLPTMGPA